MHGPSASGAHRQVPVVLRGQPENLQRLVGVEVLTGPGVGGQQRTGHVRPAERLEGAGGTGVDGVFGVDHHPVLAGIDAVAEGVLGVAGFARLGDGPAVVVQVHPRGDPGVARRGVAVGVGDGLRSILPRRQVVLLEQPGGAALAVVVELVDQQHIRPLALDDLGDRPGLLVIGRGEVLSELPLGRPVQRGVERGEPDTGLRAPGRLRRCRRGEGGGGRGEQGNRREGGGDGGAGTARGAHARPFGTRTGGRLEPECPLLLSAGPPGR